MTISVSQFPALAAGCLLYLTSPGLVCRATKQGKLREETKRFLDRITIVEEQHGHQHIDVYGLNVLIEEILGYYMPLNSKVSITILVLLELTTLGFDITTHSSQYLTCLVGDVGHEF